jgi:hypothetical protein
LRHGASVQESTNDPEQAYAESGELRRGPALPDVLP